MAPDPPCRPDHDEASDWRQRRSRSPRGRSRSPSRERRQRSCSRSPRSRARGRSRSRSADRRRPSDGARAAAAPGGGRWRDGARRSRSRSYSPRRDDLPRAAAPVPPALSTPAVAAVAAGTTSAAPGAAAAPPAGAAAAGAGAPLSKAEKLAAFRARVHVPQLRPPLPSPPPLKPPPPAPQPPAPARAADADADAAADADADPLDAYMRAQIYEAAARDVAASAACEAAELAAGPRSLGDEDAGAGASSDLHLHCYICKQHGHTKKDCPNKKCRFCAEPGHAQRECPAYQRHLDDEALQARAQKRQSAYAAKKEAKKEEWAEHLRRQTGIEGFEVLYTILELPPRKLASKAQISKAYHRISLRCHPDKIGHLPDDEREKSSERFLAAKAAYDLLCEGMENGGKGFGGPVFSAGDIEARFASTTGVALARASEAAEAARAGPADGAG